eukprot:CAMPEP_0195123542 /NCGR_PEP_ID=MMETSP0448-20130528/128848_1 /TAXON_ID=66468 /ORGANISM="Heterocapsa triquestra, Strain CCMP 448" /LENGTH=57 /DNA_ID=CAMNT_0040161099 /DNA_START=447 /DNA_END=619 /DNA_ORIENTATION=-
MAAAQLLPAEDVWDDNGVLRRRHRGLEQQHEEQHAVHAARHRRDDAQRGQQVAQGHS